VATGVRGDVDRVVQAAAEQQAGADRAEQAAERAEQAIARGDELASRMEQDIARAGDAATSVERNIERAEETAGTMERTAERVESSAGHVQSALQRSAEVAAEVEAKLARAENRAGAVEQHADRAIAAVTAAERQVSRANEAAGDADRHASRAGEQAGAVEETARRLAEAAAAAEREAERARDAAAAAEKAAGVARQAADEAGASRHGHPEERRVISPYEPHANAETSGLPPLAAVSAEENGQRGGPVQAAAPATPAGADPHRPLFSNRGDDAPKRDDRPGFDDVNTPMATIGVDGRFKELNQAFSDLVGYTEPEFQQAVWPPVMDRANLDKHRQQMKDLLEGRAESVEINTGYVHAQGLLVPIVGKLSLVREGDEPGHFLLQTS
jgi:PAS domain S-box-containing protein